MTKATIQGYKIVRQYETQTNKFAGTLTTEYTYNAQDGMGGLQQKTGKDYWNFVSDTELKDSPDGVLTGGIKTEVVNSIKKTIFLDFDRVPQVEPVPTKTSPDNAPYSTSDFNSL